MNKRTIENFQPEPQPNSEQKADGLQVSPAIGNTNVGSRIVCFFLGHKWSGIDFNTCSRCGKKGVGLPKFRNPPPCPPALKPP